MTLLEIIKTVGNRLKLRFPSVELVANEVKQGFSKPAFFIEVLPVQTTNLLYFKEKKTTVKITYFSKEETYIDNAAIADELSSLFSMTLAVGTQVLTINSTESEIEADKLIFTFDVEFLEAKSVIEVINNEGKTQVMLPDTELGYTQESIRLMEQLEIKE